MPYPLDKFYHICALMIYTKCYYFSIVFHDAILIFGQKRTHTQKHVKKWNAKTHLQRKRGLYAVTTEMTQCVQFFTKSIYFSLILNFYKDIKNTANITPLNEIENKVK